jgi:L-ascorbate metabolism protein UlaG (beta-lactamase superfamily)
MDVRITHIGGPTVLIEIGQLRLLNDPTFDPAGSEYPSGPNVLRKTANPALTPAELGAVDVVLLSHDHHADNLDTSGRAYLPQAKHVLTTPVGAQRLGGEARGVAAWETTEITGADGLGIRVTATPARHGPEDVRPAVGDVNGWIIEWDGQRHGALYISGDTVLFEGVEEVSRRYQVAVALLHLGSAQVPALGPVPLTLPAEEGVQLAKMMGDAIIIPVHYEGWAHFTEGRGEIEQAFAAAGLEKRLLFLPLGQPTSIEI